MHLFTDISRANDVQIRQEEHACGILCQNLQSFCPAPSLLPPAGLFAGPACMPYILVPLSVWSRLTCHNIQYIETVFPGCNMLISNVCEGAGHQVTLLYLRLVVFLCRHPDSKHVAVHINLQDKGVCSSF